MGKGSSRKVKHRGTRRRMNRRRRTQGGGAASVTDTSMNSMSKQSLAQGSDYQSIHSNQHGGMAPVGYTGMLDDSLRSYARVGVLDQSVAAASGMSDQGGGGRRKFKSKTAMKKYKLALNKMLKMMRSRPMSISGWNRWGSVQRAKRTASSLMAGSTVTSRAGCPC